MSDRCSICGFNHESMYVHCSRCNTLVSSSDVPSGSNARCWRCEVKFLRNEIDYLRAEIRRMNKDKCITCTHWDTERSEPIHGWGDDPEDDHGEPNTEYRKCLSPRIQYLVQHTTRALRGGAIYFDFEMYGATFSTEANFGCRCHSSNA